METEGEERRGGRGSGVRGCVPVGIRREEAKEKEEKKAGAQENGGKKESPSDAEG